MIARGHFSQGNVSDKMWLNKHIREALLVLAEAPPMHYEPPKPHRMRSVLLTNDNDRVNKNKEALLANTDTKTNTADGWDSAVKTHWLAKSNITEKGSFFKTAVDTTGVDTMDAAWTLAFLNEFLEEEGGPAYVNATVLDSPNVNKRALKDFESEHPEVFAVLCLLHIIGLFFKDAFNLPALKELFRLINVTGNKFRNVKWLREKLADVQQKDENVKALPQFKNGPKGYSRHGATRMASKYTCTVRAGEVNPATKVVMNLPRYEEKYEDANVGDRQDDSDDEFIRRDRRSLTEVLAECKDDLIMDTEKQRLIKLVEEVLREAFLMMKAADGDKLIAGKVWRVCTDCAALH